MNYKEFAAQFRADKKAAGAKTKIAEINTAWKEYKGKQDSATSDKIEVQQQPTEIFQQEQKKTEELPKEIQPVANVTPQEENLDREKMYTAVADSIHQALAGIVSLSTSKALQISKEQIDKLNTSGVLLLKKYDSSGKVLEYSPEIAYCLTLADIGTQVYLELRKKKATAPPQEKLPEPSTNTKQEVNQFNKLIEKA